MTEEPDFTLAHASSVQPPARPGLATPNLHSVLIEHIDEPDDARVVDALEAALQKPGALSGIDIEHAFSAMVRLHREQEVHLLRIETGKTLLAQGWPDSISQANQPGWGSVIHFLAVNHCRIAASCSNVTGCGG